MKAEKRAFFVMKNLNFMKVDIEIRFKSYDDVLCCVLGFLFVIVCLMMR